MIGFLSDWRSNALISSRQNDTLSLDDIVGSNKTVVRALGMFDKRLAKRRLKSMDASKEHEIIQRFYRIRCDFEGLQIDRATSVERGDPA